jgi:hypothetical protein
MTKTPKLAPSSDTPVVPGRSKSKIIFDRDFYNTSYKRFLVKKSKKDNYNMRAFIENHNTCKLISNG